MNGIAEIITLLGGWDRLQTHPVSLKVPGFLPLSIEIVGRGPRGGTLLSIMHWFVQNGDVMRDPDLEVEVLPQAGWWLPVSYRQDSLGVFEEAVVREGDGLTIRSRLVDELREFMDLWDRNIRAQGFVEAARKLASG